MPMVSFRSMRKMGIGALALIWIFTSRASVVPSKMAVVIAKKEAIQKDLSLILKENSLADNSIQFEYLKADQGNIVSVICRENHIKLEVAATAEEWGSTFYYGLQKLGFLFVHPRKTIVPSPDKMRAACGKSFQWKPAFKFRGFHLHTLHPNEWGHGFLMGKTEIANELVRWLARNSQNAFDLNLLRMRKKKIYKYLKEPFALSKSLGVYPGISLGAALHQQNSFKLLGLVRALTGIGSQKKLKKNARKMAENIDFSFMTMEAGTSEFTPVSYKRALGWMEGAAEVMNEFDRQLFIKVHVSSNQTHPEYGNFNFLPQYTKPEVGIFPHTVMFYGLYDEHVPMYGNENFHEMRDFTYQEMVKRPTWYYPETSYYIFMDIDVPLFLTDYMVARAEDMKQLSAKGLEGHINFTTGHEIGYWLIDWTVALLANSEFGFDPMAGIKLLGEDSGVWNPILEFQTKHIKTNGLISMITASNFQDEITKKHRIHERNLIRELNKNPELRETEIEKLEFALSELPNTSGIKNREICELMDVTFLRIKHALELRYAMRSPKKSPNREHHILNAQNIRKQAQVLMDQHIELFNRYPEASIFKKHKNPTSYQMGYGYTAGNLILWEREEEKVRREKFSPFFMNVHNILDIVL